MRLYPIHLRLEGKLALIVGGGEVAAAKAAGLAEAGVELRIVAPEIAPALAPFVASGRATWRSREFRIEDLDGARLVIAATDDAGLHARIFELGEERGLLVCCVDDPQHSNWIAPAVLRRGDLIVTVSTSGAAPALAARLRDELAKRIGAEYGEVLDALRAVRGELRNRYPAFEARRAAWRRLLDDVVLPALERGEVPALDAALLDRLEGGVGT
jgi:siroheme synthase-like protein